MSIDTSFRPINTQFDPPLPTDAPTTFDAKAQQFAVDLNPWAGEANDLATDLARIAGDVSDRADETDAAELRTRQIAESAAALGGATKWTGGATYNEGDVVYTDNGTLYRCISAVSGNTPPANDHAHWQRINLGDIQPLATSYTYDGNGRVNKITEDGVDTNITYNPDGTVNKITSTTNSGLTRVETYAYSNGRVTGMTATET